MNEHPIIEEDKYLERIETVEGRSSRVTTDLERNYLRDCRLESSVKKRGEKKKNFQSQKKTSCLGRKIACRKIFCQFITKREMNHQETIE